MSILWTTGEIVVYVGVLNSVPSVDSQGRAIATYTPRLLGTGKVPPEDTLNPAWAPLMMDGSGPSIPGDKIMAGAKAMTNIEVNKANLGTIEILQNLFPFNLTPGSWNYEDVGTIMNQEGMSYPVWFLSLRRDVAAMKDNGMRAGIRYHGSTLVDCTRRPGAKDNSYHISWEHTAIRIPTQRKYRLFDFDMSAVENLAIE